VLPRVQRWAGWPVECANAIKGCNGISSNAAIEPAVALRRAVVAKHCDPGFSDPLRLAHDECLFLLSPKQRKIDPLG